MQDSVTRLLNAIARSRLLDADEVRALNQKWRAAAGPAVDDRARFETWLIAQGILTRFQLDVLHRGNVESLFLGDYTLQDRLGRGRMAGVYRAAHPCGQTVAIKVLPPSKAKVGEALARFLREARLARRLKHPNIVRTFQKGEQRGVHYLVMEHLDGETLEDVLQRRRALPPREAVRLVHQAFQGLQHIHEHGMVHRDLKPANLMLVPGYEPGRADDTLLATVKILDIGLGRALFDDDNPEEDGPQAQMTRRGDMLGDSSYVPPEQARDAHGVDIRADVYALGCVLYEALAGQKPFPNQSFLELATRRPEVVPLPVRDRNPDVPRWLDLTLQRMLATDPALRFPTPREAAQAIEGLLLPASSGPAAVPEKTRRYLEWLDGQRDEDDAPSAPPAPPPAPVPAPATTPPRTRPTTERPRPAPPPATPTRSPPPERPAGMKFGSRLALGAGVLLLAAILGTGAVVFFTRRTEPTPSPSPDPPVAAVAVPVQPGEARPTTPRPEREPEPEPPPPVVRPSTAARLCEVPQLRGEKPGLALQMLRLAELQGRKGVFYLAPASWRPDLDPEVVAMQSPLPRLLVPEGTTVACWTFVKAEEGRPIIAMPNLRGLKRTEAITRIREVGLALMDGGRDTELDDLLPVADHYPRPGQSVYRGTSVFLQLEQP